MEQHQELTFFGGDLDKAAAALVAAADARLGDWTREADVLKREERNRKNEFDPNSRNHSFGNSKLVPPVFLVLQDMRCYEPPKEEWKVTTVCPLRNGGDWNVTTANAAVRSFYAWAAPILDGAGVMVSLSDARQSPLDWMIPQLAGHLQAAVAHGYPEHPDDCKRWNQFVVAAHRTKARMLPSDLRAWLVEDREFDQRDADRLAIRYENGLDLLTVYEELHAEPGP